MLHEGGTLRCQRFYRQSCRSPADEGRAAEGDEQGVTSSSKSSQTLDTSRGFVRSADSRAALWYSRRVGEISIASWPCLQADPAPRREDLRTLVAKVDAPPSTLPTHAAGGIATVSAFCRAGSRVRGEKAFSRLGGEGLPRNYPLARVLLQYQQASVPLAARAALGALPPRLGAACNRWGSMQR